MNIRQKLTLFTISALILVQVFVGALFVYLHYQHLSDQAYAAISDSFAALDEEVSALFDRVSLNAKILAGRRDLVSSVAMIANYQDTENYRTLVFDVEKKTLSQELVKAANTAQVAVVVAFTQDKEPIAFAIRGEDGKYTAGYRSYANGVAVNYTTAPELSGEYVPSEIPAFLHTMPYHELLTEGHVDFHAWEYGLYMEAGEPIIRRFPDGTAETVGSLWVREHLNAGFAELVSRKTGQEFSFIIPGETTVGNLQASTDNIDIDALPVAKLFSNKADFHAWDGDIAHFLGFRAMEVVDGGKAVTVFGVPKSQLWSGLSSFFNAAVLVLVVSLIIVIPVMLTIINKTINAPLGRLMSGVDALRKGQFIKLTGFKHKDELTDLASSFNTMVEAIGEREEDLILAKEEAEIANRTKSIFLANMSHELRTPLNAINGFSEMMMQKTFGDLSKPYEEYAGYINQSGNHLLHIISDILDMTKVEVGKIDLHEELIDPVAIIRETIDLTQTDASSSGVEVALEHTEGCKLFVDPLRLKQCVLNLLSNAYKFAGGGSVKIAAKYDEGEGYSIAVTDSGCGMTDSEVVVAMEPFRQLGNGDMTANQHEGTGLGLTLTKKLVNFQGGDFKIESEPDVGTTVTMTFPPDRCQFGDAPFEPEVEAG